MILGRCLAREPLQGLWSHRVHAVRCRPARTPGTLTIMSEKTTGQDTKKQKTEDKEPLGPCMESQSDGAPCDCAQSDCQSCGKGVPQKH